jgi:hypothetical protein
MQGKRLACEELFYGFKEYKESLKGQKMERALLKVSAHRKRFVAFIP